MLEIKNFINGEFAPSQNGKTLDLYDPATGKAYGTLPASNGIDVVMAYQSARKAYESWSKSDVKKRVKIFNKIADLIDQNLEALAQAESKDVGKPLWLAKEVDIPRAALNFRYFAGLIEHHIDQSSQLKNTINYTLNQPMGVAGLISPWNLPLYLLTWKIAPALIVGNTAICKPSEVTPATAFMLGEILNEAGLPPGVCNIIHGNGADAGAAIVSHPGIPLVSFTGGTDTGEKISQLAAPHFKKVGLELGGKNANIIFKDADLKKAVKGTIRSSFLNSGQICLCGSRVFIQDGIYDEFMAEFTKQVKELKVGDPCDKNNFMGPVVSKEQFEKVNAAIAQAKKENGVVVCGEENIDLPEENKGGYFIRPTVIADLTDCSDLWQKEIFGPVITVRSFKYAHEAATLANTNSYGLSASIWTKDLARAHKTAAAVEAGTVWVNTWLKRDLRMPFGGMKHSGIGREGADRSLSFYTEQKTVCINYG